MHGRRTPERNLVSLDRCHLHKIHEVALIALYGQNSKNIFLSQYFWSYLEDNYKIVWLNLSPKAQFADIRREGSLYAWENVVENEQYVEK